MRTSLLAIPWALILLALTGCAAHRPKPQDKEISLTVTEYKEGDRSALLRVENQSKRYFLFHGPYVEFRTNQTWAPYPFAVPEMNILGRAHRLGPAQSDSWWVRLPENKEPWRAFIEGAWLARADAPTEPKESFKVFTPENSRDSGR